MTSGVGNGRDVAYLVFSVLHLHENLYGEAVSWICIAYSLGKNKSMNSKVVCSLKATLSRTLCRMLMKRRAGWKS